MPWPKGRPRTSNSLPAAPSRETMLGATMGSSVTTLDDLDRLVDGAGGPLGDVGGEALSQARRQGRRVNTIEHTRSRMITLYDPTGDARIVPLNNLTMCLANGLTESCPKCRGYHQDDSPNACPARPPLLFTRCPICATHGTERRIYEDRLHPEDLEEQSENADENYVVAALPSRQSREAQLTNKLRLHMRAYHKSEAEQLYGLVAAEGG